MHNQLTLMHCCNKPQKLLLNQHHRHQHQHLNQQQHNNQQLLINHRFNRRNHRSSLLLSRRERRTPKARRPISPSFNLPQSTLPLVPLMRSSTTLLPLVLRKMTPTLLLLRLRRRRLLLRPLPWLWRRLNGVSVMLTASRSHSRTSLLDSLRRLFRRSSVPSISISASTCWPTLPAPPPTTMPIVPPTAVCVRVRRLSTSVGAASAP